MDKLKLLMRSRAFWAFAGTVAGTFGGENLQSAVSIAGTIFGVM